MQSENAFCWEFDKTDEREFRSEKSLQSSRCRRSHFSRGGFGSEYRKTISQANHRCLINKQEGGYRALCEPLVPSVSYTHDSAAGDITYDPATNTSMPLLSAAATAPDLETKEARKKKSGGVKGRHGQLIHSHYPLDNKWNHSDMSRRNATPSI